MTKHHTKSFLCYTILGHTLTLVEQHMYLGVKLDHRLSWHPHISKQVIRIHEKKSSKLSKIFKFQAIYYTNVRILCTNMGPIPPVWYQMIQHGAARFALKKPWRWNYWDGVSSMLADLQWPLQSQRRKCARLTLLNKSLNNLLSIPSTYLPVPTPLLSTTSNHNQKFLHYHISWSLQILQEQYRSGMISLQELYNVNHSTFLISIFMNILLHNCMLHISPYAPCVLWWSQ